MKNQKAEEYFIKAKELYSNKKYDESFKFFKACVALNHRAEESKKFIRNIELGTHESSSKNNASKGTFKEANSAKQSSSNNNGANKKSSTSQDIKEIMDAKDYYKLFGVTKDAPIDEIKKAYKKAYV